MRAILVAVLACAPIAATAADLPLAGIGVASFYHEDYRTASGERFNPRAMTCAHPQGGAAMPFNSVLEVLHLGNGRRIECRVNDHGPHIKGRLIDLTPAGARALGMLAAGTAPVLVTVLRFGGGE